MGLFNPTASTSSSTGQPKTIRSDENVCTYGDAATAEPPNYLRVPVFYILPEGNMVLEPRFLVYEEAIAFFTSHTKKSVLGIGLLVDPDAGGGNMCEIKRHVWVNTMRYMQTGGKGGVMTLVPILG